MPTQVLLNGQPRDLEMPTTVQALVTKLGLHPDQVAVEVNRKLVPRAQQGQVLLAEGDRIEIVTLVGGG